MLMKLPGWPGVQLMRSQMMGVLADTGLGGRMLLVFVASHGNDSFDVRPPLCPDGGTFYKQQDKAGEPCMHLRQLHRPKGVPDAMESSNRLFLMRGEYSTGSLTNVQASFGSGGSRWLHPRPSESHLCQKCWTLKLQT